MIPKEQNFSFLSSYVLQFDCWLILFVQQKYFFAGGQERGSN